MICLSWTIMGPPPSPGGGGGDHMTVGDLAPSSGMRVRCQWRKVTGFYVFAEIWTHGKITQLVRCDPDMSQTHTLFPTPTVCIHTPHSPYSFADPHHTPSSDPNLKTQCIFTYLIDSINLIASQASGMENEAERKRGVNAWFHFRGEWA